MNPDPVIQENLNQLRQRVDDAAVRSGRKSEDIQLMAVSKTKPVEQILPVYACGQRLFGENRVKEAWEKFQEIPSDAEVHLIGHLQSNKAKLAAETFSWVQSIDKLKTARVLDKECGKIGKTMNILLEVNTSGEESKNGFTGESDYFEALESMFSLPNIAVRGLMTIAPFTDNETAVRRSFRDLKNLYDKTQSRYPDLLFDTLSMGMSGDFEWAIEEGSTLIRLGTVIFGSRNYQK